MTGLNAEIQEKIPGIDGEGLNTLLNEFNELLFAKKELNSKDVGLIRMLAHIAGNQNKYQYKG